MSLINQKLIAMRKEVTAIEKGRKSEDGKPFTYRSIDDFYDFFNPLLAAHEIDFSMQVTNTAHEWRNGNKCYTRVTLLFIFTAEDDSYSYCEALGEAESETDRGSWWATTDAIKNMFEKKFLIKTGEKSDTEAHKTVPMQPKQITEEIVATVKAGMDACKTETELTALFINLPLDQQKHTEINDYSSFRHGEILRDGKSV